MADSDHTAGECGAVEDASRRRFLKGASLAIGGGITVVVAGPLVRYVLFPVGENIVSSPDRPIDVIGERELDEAGGPVKVHLIAASGRDAWSVSEGVALGSAWIRRTEKGEIVAFSSVCPHLGCAIGFDSAQTQYACPCHRSAFNLAGDKLSGPSKRGLDALATETKNGRILVTFQRFRQDIAEKVPTV